ncbi:MAG: hypothetical protein COV76_05355, partial [Candidatus Omnitrophica bacterium CG11_big_fil_rev_8_21_14_0_20_64_10]
AYRDLQALTYLVTEPVRQADQRAAGTAGDGDDDDDKAAARFVAWQQPFPTQWAGAWNQALDAAQSFAPEADLSAIRNPGTLRDLDLAVAVLNNEVLAPNGIGMTLSDYGRLTTAPIDSGGVTPYLGTGRIITVGHRSAQAGSSSHANVARVNELQSEQAGQQLFTIAQLPAEQREEIVRRAAQATARRVQATFARLGDERADEAAGKILDLGEWVVTRLNRPDAVLSLEQYQSDQVQATYGEEQRHAQDQETAHLLGRPYLWEEGVSATTRWEAGIADVIADRFKLDARGVTEVKKDVGIGIAEYAGLLGRVQNREHGWVEIFSQLVHNGSAPYQLAFGFFALEGAGQIISGTDARTAAAGQDRASFLTEPERHALVHGHTPGIIHETAGLESDTPLSIVERAAAVADPVARATALDRGPLAGALAKLPQVRAVLTAASSGELHSGLEELKRPEARLAINCGVAACGNLIAVEGGLEDYRAVAPATMESVQNLVFLMMLDEVVRTAGRAADLRQGLTTGRPPVSVPMAMIQQAAQIAAGIPTTPVRLDLSGLANGSRVLESDASSGRVGETITVPQIAAHLPDGRTSIALTTEQGNGIVYLESEPGSIRSYGHAVAATGLEELIRVPAREGALRTLGVRGAPVLKFASTPAALSAAGLGQLNERPVAAPVGLRRQTRKAKRLARRQERAIQAHRETMRQAIALAAREGTNQPSLFEELEMFVQMLGAEGIAADNEAIRLFVDNSIWIDRIGMQPGGEGFVEAVLGYHGVPELLNDLPVLVDTFGVTTQGGLLTGAVSAAVEHAAEATADPAWMHAALRKLAAQYLGLPSAVGSEEQFERGLAEFMPAAQELFTQWYGLEEVLQRQGRRFQFDESGQAWLVGEGRAVRTWDCLKASRELQLLLSPYLERFGVTPEMLVGRTRNNLFTRDVVLSFRMKNGNDYKLSIVPTADPLRAQVIPDEMVPVPLAQSIVQQRALGVYSVNFLRPVQAIQEEGMTEMIFLGLEKAGADRVTVKGLSRSVRDGKVVAESWRQVTAPIKAMGSGSVETELSAALAAGGLEAQLQADREQSEVQVIGSGQLSSGLEAALLSALATPVSNELLDPELTAVPTAAHRLNYADSPVMARIAEAALNEMDLLVVPDQILAGMEAADQAMLARFFNGLSNRESGRTILYGAAWDGLALNNGALRRVPEDQPEMLGRMIQTILPGQGADAVTVHLLSDDRKLQQVLTRRFGLRVSLAATGREIAAILHGVVGALTKLTLEQRQKLVTRFIQESA